ncbi:MAG: hypothetical protein ACFCUQ_16390 [Kiloniellales bacterium]
MLTRLVSLLSLLAVLTACGPLPQPFQPEDKEALDLAAYSNLAAVLVLPLEAETPRAAPGNPRQASEAMAAALSGLGLPAATRAPLAEHLLAGRVSLGLLANGHDAIDIVWELRDTGGTRLAEHRQRSELPAGLWQAGQAAAVASVMAEAAPALAALKRQADEAEAAAIAPPAERHLVILAPEDAPGDGRESLRRALVATLRGADVPVSDEIGDTDLLVLCTVELSPAGPDWQELRLTWQLVRASDGADLGRIEQESRIPAGSLDGPWGRIALDIARGAAEGLIDLLNRLGTG